MHIRIRWRRYDQALGDIAFIVREKYPDMAAIDIGANVGDTAAIICAYEDIPVLAIEGNSRFIPYLHENARRLGCHIKVLNCFVGPPECGVDLAAVATKYGTSSVVSAVNNDGVGCKMRDLASIVDSHPAFRRARLLKIDTDGFDFQIIMSSISYLATARPVLFFEYDTGFSRGDEENSQKTIEKLTAIGYVYFVIYDNFGNFLLSTTIPQTFAELNSYLRSNRANGMAVSYFDVCCFHRNDEDLFDRLRSLETSR
ncbi:MAG: FkbM family methyltransferase [Thermoleophilia bacterium]